MQTSCMKKLHERVARKSCTKQSLKKKIDLNKNIDLLKKNIEKKIRIVE